MFSHDYVIHKELFNDISNVYISYLMGHCDNYGYGHKHPFLQKGVGGLLDRSGSNRQPLSQLRAEIFRYLRSLSIVVIGFGVLVWSIYFCSELWKVIF